eukprot:14514389-Heterocapsa_arctica.AAC.1
MATKWAHDGGAVEHVDPRAERGQVIDGGDCETQFPGLARVLEYAERGYRKMPASMSGRLVTTGDRSHFSSKEPGARAPKRVFCQNVCVLLAMMIPLSCPMEALGRSSRSSHKGRQPGSRQRE